MFDKHSVENPRIFLTAVIPVKRHEMSCGDLVGSLWKSSNNQSSFVKDSDSPFSGSKIVRLGVENGNKFLNIQQHTLFWL